jgi:hypothetical protein
MKLRSFVLASVAALAMANSALAGGLDRCQDLPDFVTADNASNPKVTGYTNPGGLDGTQTTVAMYCPSGAAAGTCTGESLSEQVPGPIVVDRFDGIVADILQHQTGEVDVKESVKAYLAAVKEAIKNGDPIPKPGPQYEVVDWDPPTQGSHC